MPPFLRCKSMRPFAAESLALCAMQQDRSHVWVRWQPGEARSALSHIKNVIFANAMYAGGPRLFVQVREFAVALGVSLKASHWWRWYKDYGRPPRLDDTIQLILGEPQDLRPSLTQAKAAGLDDVAMTFCSREATTSPGILVLHLLDWAGRLRPARRPQSCSGTSSRRY